ncbi:hypothetical protein ACLB1R_31140 [Escherichia coli]
MKPPAPMQTVMPWSHCEAQKRVSYSYTATLTRNNTVAYQQVTFIGDTNSAQLQPLTASLNSIVAGNSTGSTLTATILDAYQNPLKDQLVTFQVAVSL